jgi:hypothetical protein
MKVSLWTTLAAGALLALGSLSPAYGENSQQAKMTSCNADAKTKNLSGDDRKAFMQKCLSASGGSASHTNSQQEKMKSCNADASGKKLKGDDRKKFMSECLKGSS